jgi:hypothetical protein
MLLLGGQLGRFGRVETDGHDVELLADVHLHRAQHAD